MSIIQIRHLYKTFGTGESAVHALEDINLDIQEGEIYGIIGLSGAGKSTLVRCMNLLERPTSGTVIVDGKDMTPGISRRYTGGDTGRAVENLRLLAERGRAGDVLARVPLIPGYNTEADRRESIRQLEGMGFGRFDEFTYITGLEYEKRKTDVLHFEGDSPADSGGE